MSTVSATNQLAAMLDTAFNRLDSNHDKKGDLSEFNALLDFIRGDISADQADKLGASAEDLFKSMDQNGDGTVTREEMQNTAKLMSAQFSSQSLDSLLSSLGEQVNAASVLNSQQTSSTGSDIDSALAQVKGV